MASAEIPQAGKSCDIKHTITGESMSTHVSLLARTWTDDDSFFAPITTMDTFAAADIDKSEQYVTTTEDTNEVTTRIHEQDHEDDLARTADASRTLSSLMNHFAFISPNRLIRIDEVIDASFCYGHIHELYHPVRTNDRSMWLKPVFIHPETRREAFKTKPNYEPLTSMVPRSDILFALPTFQLPSDFNFLETLPAAIRSEIFTSL
jgi:hypothetical protein